MKLFITSLVVFIIALGTARAGIEIDDRKAYPNSYTTGPSNDKLVKVTCPGAKVIVDYDMPSPGGAAGRDIIILNPKYMRTMPWQARLFMFAHECGHLNIGDDESEADHFAVRKGVAEGWLKREHLKPICEDYGDAPPSYENGRMIHPAGATRCKQNAKWFEEEIAKITEPAKAEDADTASTQSPASCPQFIIKKPWWKFW